MGVKAREISNCALVSAWNAAGVLAALGMLFALVVGCSAPARTVRLGREPVVRIGVLVGVKQVVVSCDGNVRLWRRGTGLHGTVLRGPLRLRFFGSKISDSLWAASEGVKPARGWGLSISLIHLGRLGAFPEEIVVEPLGPGDPLRLDGRPYRGEIVVRPLEGGLLAAINVLHIEDYLLGVLPPEMGSGTDVPIEAMRAQAVAARSYALFYLGRHEDEGFDLLADPQDQVYGGISVETDRATDAVHSTRGVVAVYRGRPIRANYSSTCGGRTAESGSIWPGQDFPYLVSRKDKWRGGEPLCSRSPNFEWTETWSCEELRRIVAENLPAEVPDAKGLGADEIRRLRVTERGPSGRATVLRVETARGNFDVTGDRIRWVVRRPDGSLLRSTLIGRFRVKKGDGGCRVMLRGRGNGHGVGMCQTGAMEMARRGATASQILRHYYRGISVERWW